MHIRKYATSVAKFVCLALILIVTSYFYRVFYPDNHDVPGIQNMIPDQVAEPVAVMGFNLDSFAVTYGEVEKNQFLADILIPFNIPMSWITTMAVENQPLFDVRKIRSGRSYGVVYEQDNCSKPRYFVYSPDEFSYILMDLNADPEEALIKKKREVQKELAVVHGTIETSVYDALSNVSHQNRLLKNMEDALGWSIDFYRLNKGDRFSLLYEKRLVEGKEVPPGKVLAAIYQTSQKTHYSFYFEDTEEPGYYDENGRAMSSGFLKAPVKFSRISSSYNLRRYHPILKRIKPHLGTDYAAPYGTRIVAVADGTVSRAGRTRGNGNYVKIRHDKTYETQYLHMQKFAPGIKAGAKVKQGSVIGYVGSTGLATGPHVCFRFWKNGQQVNHMREELPPALPLNVDEKDVFMKRRNSYLDILYHSYSTCTEEELHSASEKSTFYP